VALPGNVNLIRVRGYWYDQDGTGSGQTVTFTPSKTLLIDLTAHAYIRLETIVVSPDEGTSLFFADVIASNDPDLQSVTWTIALQGGPTYQNVIVPYDAPSVDVGGPDDMQAVWLTELTA
jgi:hypothetical protein